MFSPVQLSDIADLATQVATHGAIRAAEVGGGDDLFQLIIGIAILIYETHPN